MSFNINGNLCVISNLSIGKTNPGYTMDVSGNIYISGYTYSSYFSTTSDYRIKENPIELDNTFTVDELRPVRYKNTVLNKEDYGFIAHEMQNVYPALVEGEKNGEHMQSINYSGILPILVNEIKSLKHRIETLEEKFRC